MPPSFYMACGSISRDFNPYKYRAPPNYSSHQKIYSSNFVSERENFGEFPSLPVQASCEAARGGWSVEGLVHAWRCVLGPEAWLEGVGLGVQRGLKVEAWRCWARSSRNEALGLALELSGVGPTCDVGLRWASCGHVHWCWIERARWKEWATCAKWAWEGWSGVDGSGRVSARRKRCGWAGGSSWAFALVGPGEEVADWAGASAGQGDVGDGPLVPITYCNADDISKKLEFGQDMAKVCRALNIPLRFLKWRWLLSEYWEKDSGLPPAKDVERKAAAKSSRDEATSSQTKNMSPLRKKPRFSSAEKTQVGSTPSSSTRVKHLVGADSTKVGGMLGVQGVLPKPPADKLENHDMLREVARAQSSYAER
ncbi:unnamed protein product [Prunus armeniaca]